MPRIAKFFNASLCIHGELVDKALYVDLDNGIIAPEVQPEVPLAETFDLQGHVIAPAYLELQTNGCVGFHFTQFKDPSHYQNNLRKVAAHLLSTGVTSFWATVPTVEPLLFKQVLEELRPKQFNYGADLLGAHCEGPWLNPAKKGAHNSSLMQWPSRTTVEEIYGEPNIKTIKMVTLAPELPDAMGLISHLAWGRKDHQAIVSLGHSNADYGTATFALTVGAKALTHVFNAMTPLNHREPGLAGTISGKSAPYYSIIADGIHVHPATVSMAFRANPEKCMLITDSIEMAGLPDGIYPGHGQIPFEQEKVGNKVTIKGTDTLIGSCIPLDQCVRNLMSFSDCSLAQAVRCVTENIATLMRLHDRGFLMPGKRADFVIMDRSGNIKEVWMRSKCVWNSMQSPMSTSPSGSGTSGQGDTSNPSTSHSPFMAIVP